MQKRTHRKPHWSSLMLGVWIVFSAGGPAWADDSNRGSGAVDTQVWQRGAALVGEGRFSEAADLLGKVGGEDRLTGEVLGWLNEFRAKQAHRLEMDRADLEKYAKYAQERIERKEYALALDWAFRCADVAADREAFLQTDWLRDLTNLSLAKAEKLREKGDWLGAWHLYSDLGALFEREPRYKKLEREAQTHYRLDVMFEKGSHWEESLEQVRWEDARAALEGIALHYVEVADFKAMCESALEQALFLADSKSAQETFEGLKDEDSRAEFVARVKVKLEQVRRDPSLERRDCVEHLRRVVSEINEQTVHLPKALLVSELMRGALDPLDDYTTIIWPTRAEEFDKNTNGDFIGVGISIHKNRITDEIEVVTPLEDSPAYRAGVQAGDVITTVDGVSLDGYTLTKVVKTITGPAGTDVQLTIRRGENTIEFPLVRERIKIASVKGMRRDPDNPAQWDHWADEETRIGYVRLTNFQRNTAEDLANTLSRLEASDLKGLILDLRGNPGGLLDSAWRISSMFLNRGDTVVTTKGRHRSENQNLKTPGDGPFSDIPMTVLTDESSASASEIVAGAIRDNHRGLVVGARTFGKFSVQNLLPLGRTNARLKITTAHYYLPSGVSLHRNPQSETWGVEPNVPIRLVRKEKLNLWALRRENDLIGPPKPETETDGDKADPAKDGAAEDGAAKDGSGKADAQKSGDSAIDADGKADDQSDGPKLPPIEQPDENDRPKEDPQLDAALLVMRINLLSMRSPSLVTAEVEPDHAKVARP